VVRKQVTVAQLRRVIESRLLELRKNEQVFSSTEGCPPECEHLLHQTKGAILDLESLHEMITLGMEKPPNW
jgi:hypothetical protein